jgi:hypothetical protein
MLPVSLSYRLITRDIDRSLEQTASQPIVAREIAHYRDTIKSIKSIDDFLADDRVFRFAMTAYGLEDMAYAKAFMRKVLEEGIDANDSFANQLADPRYREFAEVFNFARYGETATVFDRASQGTMDRYVRQTLEVQAGDTNEAVRLALYFQRKAPNIESPYQLLGDQALLAVSQVLAGLPPTSSSLSIEKQAAAIESRINIEDLKDPAKVQEMMERFTVLWEARNPTQSRGTVPSILVQGGPVGFSEDLLASIQALNFTRR